MRTRNLVMGLVLTATAAGFCGCQTDMTAETQVETDAFTSTPVRVKSHWERALEYEARGQNGPAIQEYRLALRDNPKDSRIYVNLGLLYQREQQFGRAERHWQQAVKINPNDARAYNLLGNIYKRQENFNKAIAYYAKALEANPNLPVVHWNLAVCFRNLDMKREAVRHYRRYVALSPPEDTTDRITAKRYMMTVADE